jgi:hypothetical protein
MASPGRGLVRQLVVQAEPMCVRPPPADALGWCLCDNGSPMITTRCSTSRRSARTGELHHSAALVQRYLEAITINVSSLSTSPLSPPSSSFLLVLLLLLIIIISIDHHHHHHHDHPPPPSRHSPTSSICFPPWQGEAGAAGDHRVPHRAHRRADPPGRGRGEREDNNRRDHAPLLRPT